MTQTTDNTEDRASRFVTTEDDGVVITPAGSGEFEDFPGNDEFASTPEEDEAINRFLDEAINRLPG